MDLKYYTEELKNGMKILLVPRKTNGLIYFSLVMKNGRIDETKHTLSYTHIFEHLLARFTSKKYPNFNAVKKRLGYLGVESNAYTANFTTGYWLLGNKNHLNFYVNLLSEAYFHYKFQDTEKNIWEKQRNIVMEEIKMRSTNIWNPLDEEIDKIMYPNHRLSDGWKENLQNVSKAKLKDVLEFNRRKLNPKNTIILVEGDFEVGLIMPLLRKHFQQMKATDIMNYELEFKPIKRTEKFPKTIRQYIPGANSAKIVYTFEINDISKFDLKMDATLLMMMRYFCVGYYSRLYQVLREKHGLIYRLNSSYDLSPDPAVIPGALQIEITVDAKKVQDVLDIVGTEIERLQKLLVPRTEMERLKNLLFFNKAMEILNKTPGKFVEYYVSNMIWDQPIVTYTEYYDLLRKVKPIHIQAMAKRIFQPYRMLIAIGEPKF